MMNKWKGIKITLVPCFFPKLPNHLGWSPHPLMLFWMLVSTSHTNQFPAPYSFCSFKQIFLEGL